MKKMIFITGIFLFFSSSLFSQVTGLGTLASPYTGTVIGPITWYPDTYPNQTIIVNNLTVTTTGTLTISSGIYYGGRALFNPIRTLTIDNGGAVIINPNIGVSVYQIINNGTLTLVSGSNEAGVASLIHDVYSGTGSTNVSLYLSGGTTPLGAYRWHYIAVPVSNVNVSTFTSQTTNLAQYVDNLVTGPDNYPGWVTYDGYQYATGNTLTNTFSTLTLGQGYNYYSGGGFIYTFSGPIYIGTFLGPIALTCGLGYTDYQGYNLMGNPFASCLNWDYMVTNNMIGTADNAIYFTLNGGVASYVNGVGDNGGEGSIPPMQGFFVKTNSLTELTFPSAARVHKLDQFRYKKKSTGEHYENPDTISFIRLKLQGVEDSTDLVVRFNKKATVAFDKKFDAYEFNRAAGDLNIWSTIGDIDYGINGLPFPQTTMEVPVGINVKTAGTLTIGSNELNKLDNYSVILKDLSNNTSVDLKKGGSIQFNAPVGMTEDRFILAITNTNTGIPEIPGIGNKFSIYTNSGMINIRALTNEFSKSSGTVSIYDQSGRKLYHQQNAEWHNTGDIVQVTLNPARQGIYIVEVKSGNMKYVEKVILYR